MGSLRSKTHEIEWQTSSLSITLVVGDDDVVRLRSLRPSGTEQSSSRSTLFEHSDLPLTSLRLVGDGNTSIKTAKSLIGSYVSERLKYQHHVMQEDEEKDTLIIHSLEETAQLLISVHLIIFKGIPVVRSFVEATNKSESSYVIMSQLSSLTIGGMTTSSSQWYHDYSLMTATNGWFRETQWREQSLPEIGIDEDGICQLPDGHLGSQAIFSLSNRGSFSTGSHLPMGLLKRNDNKDTWLWQIEHNGSWRWEVGDFKDSIYICAGGPTSYDHDCRVELGPGEKFTTVPVACCRTSDGIEQAFGAITQYRRAIRRPHADNENLPIIFNDYMNCLMGDPDEDKIKALLQPVAKSGAEYFVIDAGWYADDGDWWDDVGSWEPSQKRFPTGFKSLLDTIRASGLIPGLWLEPEVVGVRSKVAKQLPAEAFFHEGGQRLVERGRYQLDFRQPVVIDWMNSVVRRLVVDYGAGYFKFDYNIEVLSGTDVGTKSVGMAHLEHQRAYLSWVQRLLDQYPDLVIENCSSGAQRMEYAMLAVHPLQSTSDQQDPVLYAAIAAAVPTAVTPEQSASWAYPQPAWDDEMNAFTIVNSLIGRVHLSGRLDILSDKQYALVVQGMEVYKGIRQHLRRARPTWPLGLPKWHDKWICLGMVDESGCTFLAVWRRGGPTEINIPLRMAGVNAHVAVELLFPEHFETAYSWCRDTQTLQVQVPSKVCARLFRLSTTSS